MQFVIQAMLQAAALPWSPPAQAEWPKEDMVIEANLLAIDGHVSLETQTKLTLILSTRNSDFLISPFLAATRGVAFEVLSEKGDIVVPREPIAISPPAPSMTTDKLTRVGKAAPLKIDIVERSVNIFPQPGHYRVRAIVRLMNSATSPAIYKQVRTGYVDVDVTP